MIQFYDNNYATTDRYSMVVKEGALFHHYSFSMNAGAPDGINMYNGTYEIAHSEPMGERIDWIDLPLQVQVACLQRLDPRE